MDIEFELERLLLSRDFRQKLNKSLADRGYLIHVALIDQLRNVLVPGGTPGINPAPTESNELREEDVGFLAGLPGSSDNLD
uniref:Uncharacterized protein n=1 Tax=Leviviridae sp. TaxID=2027243 RepID=A0A514CZW4_9VIRU|nr:MAG: hypothetical protein H2Bulk34293_000003 [Leviviridae sp.]